MIVNKDMIITLENKESYFVATTTIYEKEKYGLLININKEDEYIVGKLLDEYVEIIDNENELLKIYPLLNESLV